MKTLIFAALLALSFSATAQKEDNVWIFAGNRIDFTTEPPTVTPVGIDYVTELNITSVADRDGRLAYWLNGTSLYNSNDELIFSTPAAQNDYYFYGLSIVPFPGRDNVYLFVYPDLKNSMMVASIVDGSKDLLHPEITDRYADFPHFWGYGDQVPDGTPLFFQKYGSRNFWMLYSYYGKIKVYELTEDGFQYTGKVYEVPKFDDKMTVFNGFEMTPDRSKILADASLYGGDRVFIDLDTKTGEIKSMNKLCIHSMDAWCFSSGNKYMYYSCMRDRSMYRIPVEALAVISNDDDFVNNSEFVGVIGCGTGDMKFLMSGGVYYMPENGSGYLGVVRDCDSDHPTLDNQAILLARHPKEHKASWILAYPKTYCYPYGFTAAEQCGGEVHFAYTDDNDYASLLWDFGDGTTSADPAPVHSYTANGKYTVSVTINYNSTDRPTRIVTQDVFVNNITKKLVIVRE